MTTPDLEQIVAKYIALRDKAKQLKADYEVAVRPYNEAMEKLENVASLLMGTAQSVRTDSGTIYRSETMSVNVADRAVWFGWVRDHEAWDVLTTHVSKTELKEWMEGAEVPPGLDITYIKNVNFRRA